MRYFFNYIGNETHIVKVSFISDFGEMVTHTQRVYKDKDTPEEELIQDINLPTYYLK